MSSSSHSNYLGLTKEDALAQAREDDYACRVIKENGRSFPVTMDHNPDRINFVIENGIVVKVTEG
ncbi:hypothetical protein N9A94_06215 [Akkermansiaceae bacterium]|nr:hypothetical protein [Akkermansiaceae bacterium]